MLEVGRARVTVGDAQLDPSVLSCPQHPYIQFPETLAVGLG